MSNVCKKLDVWYTLSFVIPFIDLHLQFIHAFLSSWFSISRPFFLIHQSLQSCIGNLRWQLLSTFSELATPPEWPKGLRKSNQKNDQQIYFGSEMALIMTWTSASHGEDLGLKCQGQWSAIAEMKSNLPWIKWAWINCSVISMAMFQIPLG